MKGESRALTHSVDIDLRRVTAKLKVTPEPTDQGVIGDTTIFRFRVKDGERITLDTGRGQFEVVVNPRAGGGYPVVARDDAAELTALVREWAHRMDETLPPRWWEGPMASVTDLMAARSALRAALAATEGQP